MTSADPNPYLSSKTETASPGKADPGEFRSQRQASIAWPLLLLLNLVMPLLLVGIMTNAVGWIGVAAASMVILLAGWYFCWRHTPLAWQTLAGMAVLAVTQFFPLLQIAAGVCGLMAVGVMGLKGPSSPGQPFIDSIPLGFVSVLVAGAMLITIAALFGWLLKLVVPARWYGSFMIPAPSQTSRPC